VKRTIAVAVAVFITLMLQILLGCSSTLVGNSDRTAANLVGYWDWEESCGGFAGQCRTPESEGYNRTLSFQSSSGYVVYENKVPTESGKYRITQQEGSIFGSETVTMVELSESDQSFIIWNLTADTLELVENCHDCFGSLYVRANR
jgi:hypothetical protein